MKKLKNKSWESRKNAMRETPQYENGFYSGLTNHFTDRLKTLAQIRTESGVNYALGFSEGRQSRKQL